MCCQDDSCFMLNYVVFSSQNFLNMLYAKNPSQKRTRDWLPDEGNDSQEYNNDSFFFNFGTANINCRMSRFHLIPIGPSSDSRLVNLTSNTVGNITFVSGRLKMFCHLSIGNVRKLGWYSVIHLGSIWVWNCLKNLSKRCFIGWSSGKSMIRVRKKF